MLPPNRNKGTGFTNINRVLDANKGNRLGQTVVSGVQNQVNKVQGNLQKEQNEFNQAAQKNLIDTDENKQQRDNVIGRFGADKQNFAPDMSNFQASSGLQEQFNNAKNKFEQERTGYQNQMTQYQKDVAAKQKKFNSYDSSIRDGVWQGDNAADKLGNYSGGGGSILLNAKKDYADLVNYQQRLADTQKLYNGYDLDGRISQAQSEYDKGLEAERQKYIEDQQRIALAQQGPTAEELSQFEKFRAGQYQGPQQLENYSSILGDAQNTEMLGDMTRTAGGQQELLRRFVGGSGYTKGQQKLDTAIMNQNPVINEVRKTTRDLGGNVQKANTVATNLAQEYGNRNKQFAKDTVQTLQGKINPLSSEIDQRLTDIQTQEAAKGEEYNALKQALAKNGVAGAVEKGLINKFQADSLKRANDKFTGKTGVNRNDLKLDGGLPTSVGLDATTLLANNLKLNEAKNINRAGVANIQQESTMNALQRLLGQQAEFANPGEDYVASKTDLDFNNVNKEIYDTGLSKLTDYQKRANKAIKGSEKYFRPAYERYAMDANQLLDSWKQRSKYFGYDPENE